MKDEVSKIKKSQEEMKSAQQEMNQNLKDILLLLQKKEEIKDGDK